MKKNKLQLPLRSQEVDLAGSAEAPLAPPDRCRAERAPPPDVCRLGEIKGMERGALGGGKILRGRERRAGVFSFFPFSSLCFRERLFAPRSRPLYFRSLFPRSKGDERERKRERGWNVLWVTTLPFVISNDEQKNKKSISLFAPSLQKKKNKLNYERKTAFTLSQSLSLQTERRREGRTKGKSKKESGGGG